MLINMCFPKEKRGEGRGGEGKEERKEKVGKGYIVELN